MSEDGAAPQASTEAAPPESSHEARESRRHRTPRNTEAEPVAEHQAKVEHEAKAEHAAQPAALPSAQPGPVKERADPTLRSDGNPYLQR